MKLPQAMIELHASRLLHHKRAVCSDSCLDVCIDEDPTLKCADIEISGPGYNCRGCCEHNTLLPQLLPASVYPLRQQLPAGAPPGTEKLVMDVPRVRGLRAQAQRPRRV
mmetsp:Transcript_20730/g.44522  ORF Transcript_20730/g.44522 Transcript_20730/m.44522 type:complete len:109 (-) Transcript_20730:454-780(-)